MLSSYKKSDLSERQISIITWALLCISPLTGMAIDLITPALPLIAQDLQVPDYLSQILIALYLCGYALGNFFTGIITTAFSRQVQVRVLLISFAIISLLPVVIPNIMVLLATRLLQGVVLGGVAVLIRVIVVDLIPANKLVTIGVLMGTMWGIGPVIGPFIGGYLSNYFGWQACFYFFALLSLIYFIIICCVLPETQTQSKKLTIQNISSDLVEVIQHRQFMTLAIIQGLVYGTIITFHTSGSFLVEQQLHYSVIYFGKLGFILGCVFLVATLFSRYIAGKFMYEKIVMIFIHMYIIFILIALGISYYLPNNIAILIVATMFMFALTGNIFPLSIGKGLSLFKHTPGIAASVQYLINMSITAVISLIVSVIDIKQVSSMINVYGIIILLMTILYWSGIHSFRQRRV